jgi:N-ethylmaleimide reductase
MKLLQAFESGTLQLKNRVVMAPMTRSRAHVQGLVTPSTVEYYRQRSGAGLIITEAVNISEQAIGSPFTPGIYTEEQVQAWTKVTEAVHAEGGKIFMQLWHTGRVGHSAIRNGALPVAPYAAAIKGQKAFTPDGMKDYETPRQLSIEEIALIIADYRRAAENAKRAGFDGVELHAAFGYLPNQFMVDGVNKRTDEYGGSIEGRCRFTLEVMDALYDVFGAHRTAIRISPLQLYNDIHDSDPRALYTYLVKQLNHKKLAYLHLMEAGSNFDREKYSHWPHDVLAEFGSISENPVMTNTEYNATRAEEALSAARTDLISFGTLFISNPDLPERFRLGAPLAEGSRATFYGGGDEGYIDYPPLK